MKCTVLLVVLVALALCSATAQAQHIAPVAVVRARAAEPRTLSLGVADAPGRPMPTWLKWGLVGAAAGAVTFPLLGGLSSDSNHQAARDAVVGAGAGFVIVGGSVALWQALCGPDSSSRRAGMCGQ